MKIKSIKVAGISYSPEEEFLKGNPYAEDDNLFDKNTVSYSISIMDKISDKYASGPMFIGASKTFVKDVIDSFKQEMPYVENGKVEISISVSGLRSDFKEAEQTTWKTHPIYFKKYGANKILDTVNDIVSKANAMDKDYLEYIIWQSDLEIDKERRKGYYNPQISKDEKSMRRKEERLKKIKDFEARQTDKKEDEKVKQDLMKEHKINTPFENLSLAKSKKTIKISKSQWLFLGKQAGWIPRDPIS